MRKKCNYLYFPYQSKQIANYLGPQHRVLSGDTGSIAMAEKVAKPMFGARLCKRLPVSGAFHSEFMRPAMEPLGKVYTSLSPSPSPLCPIPPSLLHSCKKKKAANLSLGLDVQMMFLVLLSLICAPQQKKCVLPPLPPLFFLPYAASFGYALGNVSRLTLLQ